MPRREYFGSTLEEPNQHGSQNEGYQHRPPFELLASMTRADVRAGVVLAEVLFP